MKGSTPNYFPFPLLLDISGMVSEQKDIKKALFK